MCLLILLHITQKNDEPNILDKINAKVDSLYNALENKEKISLLLCANFSNENDALTSFFNLQDSGLVSNWIINNNKLLENNAKLINTCDTSLQWIHSYFLLWDSIAVTNLILPSLQSIVSLPTKDTLLSYFSENFISLLQYHNFHGFFIPISMLLNKDNGFKLSLISKLLVNFRLLFHSSYFYQPFIAIEYETNTIFLPKNSEILSWIFNFFLRFSSFSLIHNLKSQYNQTNALTFLHDQYATTNDYIFSLYDVFVLPASAIKSTHAELLHLYHTNPIIKQIIDHKAKTVLHHKLKYIHYNQQFKTKKIFSFRSTAHSTMMLKWAEYTSCVINFNSNLLPLQLPNVYFIQSSQMQLSTLHKYVIEECPDCTYIVAKNDSAYIEKIISQIPASKTLVFIAEDPSKFLITKKIENLIQNKSTVFIQFAGNISLSVTDKFSAYIYFPDQSTFYQQAALNFLIGAENIHGTWQNNQQNEKKYYLNPLRLKRTYPEDAGLDGNYLYRTIDSICNWAIQNKVFPGCQIFAAREGKIIFHKSYGHHTYENKKQIVKNTDLYDIASITKIIATTLAFMKLYEQGKISLNDKMQKFFKNPNIRFSRVIPDTLILVDTFNLKKVELQKLIQEQKIEGDTFRLNDTLLIAVDTIIRIATNKINIFSVPLRYMLLHFSGIVPSLPILPFIQNDKFLDAFGSSLSVKEKDNTQFIKSIMYTNQKSDSSMIEVSEQLYLKNRWRDSLWEMTKALGISKRKIKQYSDANMVLIQITIDSLLNKSIEHFLNNEFFQPLGLKNLCYKPLSKNISKDRIIPTEYDIHWRQQLIHGYVHDPTAALLGGVAGNAGLFANARDIGILLQMLLNGGTYGGKRYLKQQTIDLFTRTYQESGRGLGFDKYSLNNIIALSASVNSYGHTGFTGCCAWVDPDNKLVFVFLSNRLYPNASNWKINTYRIRQIIHETFYIAMQKMNI